MDITLDVPVYDSENGFEYKWEDNFKITVLVNQGTVQIISNKAGMVSLARHLLSLAQIKGEYHLHLDSYNGLEDGSAELILHKENE